MMRISGILQQHQLSDIKATDANGDTILHLVVKNEKLMPKETIEILGILLDEGLDPNIKNNKDETILHLAIANRAKDVIEFLLTRNVHFDDSAAAYLIKSEKDKTVDRNLKAELPMSHSEWEKVENESTSFVEWCLSKGLNVDGRNSFIETGLFSAFDNHLLHILPSLLKYTKNFDFDDCDNKRTLLHTFLNNIALSYNSSSRENWYSDCTRRHATAVVRMMLDKGVSTDAVDFNGNTALHLAIQQAEDISIIEMLIERSANVNLKNDEGQTPFYLEMGSWLWSYKTKTDDCMKICHHLIAKGADVNEPDRHGTSPLCNAIEYHHLQIVEFLLRSGADFSVITKDGETLLHCLANRYCFNTDDETKIQLIDMLISNGCKVNAKDDTGNTALHLAADSNDVVMVRKLIEYDAEIDARNNEKNTPLCYLIVNCNQNTDAAVLLLEHGANINARNLEGFIALHVSAAGFSYNRDIEMLKFSLKHGADFNARTGEGYSVLQMALWRNYNEFKDADNRVEPYELPSLARCIKDYISGVVEFLLKYWIKLHVANIKYFTGFEYEELIAVNKYRQYQEKCLEEIEILKTTFIDSHTSLYSVLHMDLNSRRAYIYNEKLQQLVQSLKLEKQFPEFSVLIFSSNHEAVTRKTLMEPAKKAWWELTKISLLDECIELIFSFLSNSDLFDMVERN